MENSNEERYNRAKRKVKQVKNFYSHLTVYVVINIFLILINAGLFEKGPFHLEFNSWSVFSTPVFWGIGLALHGIYVFQDRFNFLRNWEDRKIREYMEKEKNEYKQKNNWD